MAAIIFILAPYALIAAVIYSHLFFAKFDIHKRINNKPLRIVLKTLTYLVVIPLMMWGTAIAVLGLVVGIVGVPWLIITILIGIFLLIWRIARIRKHRRVAASKTSVVPTALVLAVSLTGLVGFTLAFVPFNEEGPSDIVKSITTRTEYLSVDNIEKIDGLMSVEVEISESPNGETRYKFPNTIATHYSSPYFLSIEMEFENKRIQEIEFKECEVIIDGSARDVLQQNMKDVFVSPSRTNVENGHSSAGTHNPREEALFTEKRKLIINEFENVIVDSYSIAFWDLPIDPGKQDNVKVRYILELYLIEGEMKQLSGEITFHKEITTTE